MELSYKHLKEKPDALLLLLNKYVKLQCIKDGLFEGFIQSIDPISKSIILSVPVNSINQSIIIIPGHAIISLTETTAPSDFKHPVKIADVAVKDVAKVKARVMEWLKKNLLPVSECDDKIILGNVSVLPPYRTVDICTDNAVVALQIKRIIENMPPDFEPISNK